MRKVGHSRRRRAWLQRAAGDAFVSMAVAAACLVGCQPKAPDMTRMPRFEVPFDGITDGSNPHATTVPEKQAQEQLPARKTEQPKDSQTDRVLDSSADLPDPPAASYSEFVSYELQFSRGEVSVLSAKSFRPRNAMQAERRMGRFAFELFVGHELLERVRFDFPLLGATTASELDPLESGLTTQTTVQLPYVMRATTARILDRKSRRVIEVVWPPQVQEAASAGAEQESADQAAAPHGATLAPQQGPSSAAQD